MLTKDFYQDEMLGYLGGVQREIEVTLPETGAYLFRVGNGVYSPEGPLVGNFSLLPEEIS